MNSQLINQTKILVEKYDESLKVIANLNSENRSLRDVIEKEKLKASKLVEHYEQRLCDQTSRLSSLKETIRIRDATEKEERQKGRKRKKQKEREDRKKGKSIRRKKVKESQRMRRKKKKIKQGKRQKN